MSHSYYIPKEIEKKVRTYAKEKDRSQSWVIKIALENFFRLNEVKE